MDTQQYQTIKEAINKSQSIGIIVAKNPTLDQMAGGLGLYLSLQTMNKQVQIVCSSDPLVEISNLVGIDKVKKSLAGEGGDLIVSFPYHEGEIDKVSYNLTDGLLNIVVKAGEKGLRFDNKDVNFKRNGKSVDLLFTVGVAQMTDVESFISSEQLKNTTIINIDNKQDNQGFGTVIVVSQRASSISEQIADLLTLMDPNNMIDVDIAQNLLAGIAYATRDFTDFRTSAIAFEMAGILMKKGAVRPKREFRDHREDRRQQFQQHSNRPQTGPRQPQHMRQQYRDNKEGQYREQSFSQQSQPVVEQTTQQMQQESDREQFVPQQSQQPVREQEVPREKWQNPERSTPEEQPSKETQQREPFRQDPPSDWLQPKVYKGSTVV